MSKRAVSFPQGTPTATTAAPMARITPPNTPHGAALPDPRFRTWLVAPRYRIERVVGTGSSGDVAQAWYYAYL